MARRPDPRQINIFDMLAAPAPAPVARIVEAPAVPAQEPFLPDLAELENTDWTARLWALVTEGLPPGAPPPFKEILFALADPYCRGRLWGEVTMFDGQVHSVTVLWSPGHRVYGFNYLYGETAPRIGLWTAHPAFTWDPVSGAWIRLPPSESHQAGQWSAHLSRPGYEGFLSGPPVEACCRAP